ncbi:MAG: lipid-A-disaccharide synthase [Granulosicoccus sp.]|jgi:lipid-A-disaccharide synthase
MHIGIVVGEVSGDILGASLLEVLKQRFPSCRFSGIGGNKMLAEGFDSLYPQDRLAVMGLIEPLKRLPELLRIRKRLFQYFVDEKIDLFIGIDSPDFTLALEKKLKQSGIKTIHYVSPSVWAWRQGRIKGIKKSVDWMLTLLPFEAAFYQQHNVPVTFVGHPLADQFPVVNDTLSAREQLLTLLPKDSALQNANTKIIACLPGSRRVEVEHIGGVLWQALSQLSDANPAHLHFVVPAVNAERRAQICLQLEVYPQLSVSVIEGHSQTVMAAADCVVMASGTTTLEAMLLKKPMVVVYKKDAFSYWLISRMLTVKHISLPNLLAGEVLVPELIQDAATPEAIAQATQYWLDNPQKVSDLQQRFVSLHKQLSVNASETAANVVEHLLSPASGE